MFILKLYINQIGLQNSLQNHLFPLTASKEIESVGQVLFLRCVLPKTHNNDI